MNRRTPDMQPVLLSLDTICSETIVLDKLDLEISYCKIIHRPCCYGRIGWHGVSMGVCRKYCISSVLLYRRKKALHHRAMTLANSVILVRLGRSCFRLCGDTESTIPTWKCLQEGLWIILTKWVMTSGYKCCSKVFYFCRWAIYTNSKLESFYFECRWRKNCVLLMLGCCVAYLNVSRTVSFHVFYFVNINFTSSVYWRPCIYKSRLKK